MKMTDDNKETWMKEHTKLVNKIYELCKRIDNISRFFFYGALLGLLLGAMIAFNIFIILYIKGIIQKWIP